MEEIINFANRLTDMDWGWWPFLFLRPEKNEKMTTAVVAKMALYFGSLGGVIAYVLVVALGRPGGIFLFLTILVGFMIFFFVIYRLTFAICWNYRAERIKLEESDIEG